MSRAYELDMIQKNFIISNKEDKPWLNVMIERTVHSFS
jgi:hypothetical protein